MSDDRIARVRIDLSALDPTADAARWEQLVGAIAARAAPELARRRSLRSPVVVLANWARPALSAAAAVTLAASITLAVVAKGSAAQTRDRAAPALAATLGVPTAVARWVVENRTPTATDLIAAFAGRRQ